LLGGARALLHPIYFEEPFGLSVAEAMMCGTPVIAFSRGSMPELVRNGKTGYLVSTIAEAVLAVQKLERISTQDCRTHALQKFSVETMVNSYLEVYKTVMGQRGTF
jgi:glycosyltransferase involved in cell wall biosynthesis